MASFARRRVASMASLAAVAGAFFLLGAPAAHAHVKWFAEFDYAAEPQSLSSVLTPTFWAMLALSVVVLVVLVVVDKRVAELPAAARFTAWFERYADSSLLVMRVAVFATLLVAWQLGTLFAPELATHSLWVERLQFVVILLLFWVRTTSAAGVGMIAIWFYGMDQYGFFHMLDYVNVLGVAYFLTVRPLSNATLKASALPVLYATLGFSLVWLGCEKLVYPAWVNYLLEQHPLLTLGLDKDFFRVAAAFVELGLGFLLMIGLFGRSLSIVITLTFFLTTCVFGKVEIIGHTLIHAALLVFLFEGPGRMFRPPAYFHRTTGLRMAFAGVNFVIATFVALLLYTGAARQIAAEAKTAPHDEQGHVHSELPPEQPDAAESAPPGPAN